MPQGLGHSFAVLVGTAPAGVQVIGPNPKRKCVVFGLAAAGPSFVQFGDPTFGGTNVGGIPVRPENSPIYLDYSMIGDAIYEAMYAVGQAADVIRGQEFSNL